jgi:hypothetical protein
MKRIFSSFIVCSLVFATNYLIAQPMTQGKVAYQVVDAPDGMPTSLTLSLNKTKSRWEWKTKDATIVQIINPEQNEGGTLYSEKGSKFFNNLEPNELSYFTTAGIRDQKKTEESATIAGIKASRFIMILENPINGEVREAEVWLDPSSTSQVPSIGGIPGKSGLPLEFDALFNGNWLHLKATAVSRIAVDPTNFFTIPKGLSPKQDYINKSDSVKIAEPVPSK